MYTKAINHLLLFYALFIGYHSFAQAPTDQAKKDDKILTDYFKKNKIKPLKTASGLYYTIKKKGTGPNAKPRQTVSMNYLGKFLDGNKFDANVDDKFNNIRPFSFTLGVGQVIKGWDEGVQLLNNGSRATLYIPSDLAYGPSGRGPIPPSAVLVFEVGVLSIQ
jgi:FKBP-type peptidyl-prolyl cis-trans isomerase